MILPEYSVCGAGVRRPPPVRRSGRGLRPFSVHGLRTGSTGWVLSFQVRLRCLLAWDHDLRPAVTGVAVETVLGFVLPLVLSSLSYGT